MVLLWFAKNKRCVECPLVERPRGFNFKCENDRKNNRMISQFLALLFIHWVADFILQTHWQAQNKSKNNEALARHVGVYTLTLATASWFVFGTSYDKWAAFWALNGLLHFCTDYFTSKWTSKLYAKQDWHNFFVIVGLDQLIHQFTLALTMIWLIK